MQALATQPLVHLADIPSVAQLSMVLVERCLLDVPGAAAVLVEPDDLLLAQLAEADCDETPVDVVSDGMQKSSVIAEPGRQFARDHDAVPPTVDDVRHDVIDERLLLLVDPHDVAAGSTNLVTTTLGRRGERFDDAILRDLQFDHDVLVVEQLLELVPPNVAR